MKKVILALSLLCMTSVVLVISLFTYQNYFVVPEGASAASAIPATGKITFSGEFSFMGYNEYFELNDGQGNTTTISVLNLAGGNSGVCINEAFNSSIYDPETFGSVTAPPECTWGFAADIGGGANLQGVTEALVTAINSSTIGITASWDTPGTVNLVNDVAGSAGNVAIIVGGDLALSTEVTITGMSGGDDGGSAPSVTTFSPTQASSTAVTVTTTVADGDSDVTTLFAEHSTDGSTWTSSTISIATSGTEGDGIVTSVVGSLTDIDTDIDGSVDVTITWDISTDLPNTDDSSVYFRLRPYDGTSFGTTVSSSAFTVDTVAPTAPGALSVASTSTTSVVLTFGATSTDSNFSEYRIYYKNASTSVATSDTLFGASQDTNLAGVLFKGASTTTITGLTPGLQYVMNIWAFDSYGSSSSSASEITFYTLAAQAGTPTVNNAAASTVDVTLDTTTNGTSSLYAIYNATAGNFLAASGAASDTAVYQTSSTWAGAVTATGLSGNTQYCFSIVARNGDGINAATSTQACTYTAAAVPASAAATALSGTQIKTSWAANGNASDTQYFVERVGTSDNSGWINALEYTFQGLNENTAYEFRVKARNASGTQTAYTAAFTGTTQGGTAPVAVSNPPTVALPTITTPADPADAPDAAEDADAGDDPQDDAGEDDGNDPATEPEIVELVVESGEETKPIPNTNHSIGGIISITPTRATIVVQSDPITVTLDKDVEKGLDTNGDGIIDLSAVYLGLDAEGNPKFKFVDFASASEEGKAMTINHGLKVIQTRNAQLYFNVPDASTMAISNTEDFSDASFIPYVESLPWTLTEGEGKKTVYVRFRSESGGTSDTFDTILYSTKTQVAKETTQETVISDEGEATPTCPLTPGRVYKSVGSNGVYQIFANGIVDEVITPCVKKYFSSASIFFTYYDSWDVVRVVTKERLDSVAEDDVPFIAVGPKYNLASGSLVKATKDPRVFLVVENTRRWIVSEAVFSALEYTWGWIEDVSEDLLNKYDEGTPIESETVHPAGTVFMYANQGEMYLLEGKSEDRSMLVKRQIQDIETLQRLGYRLDRVLVIDESFEYETGDPISL